MYTYTARVEATAPPLCGLFNPFPIGRSQFGGALLNICLVDFFPTIHSNYIKWMSTCTPSFWGGVAP